MQDRIPIPERVEEAIEYKGWTALSWALHNHWIKDYKWYFSEMTEKDIGVPFTVAMMLNLCNLMKETNQFYTFSEEPNREEFQKVGTRGLLMFLDRVDPNNAQQFYELLVEGYLLGTDFVSPVKAIPDEHGANQLEGELRRYWVNKSRKTDQMDILLSKLRIQDKINGLTDKNILQSKDINLTRQIINDYCETYSLNGAYDIFAERLNL